jgi:hypothetical protein
MSGKRQVEARWGVPFWQLVSDFAEQGLSRTETAKAIGYRFDSFSHLLAQNPSKDPFDSYVIAIQYLKDTGEGFREALERMSAEGRSWAYAARVIGYSDGARLKRAARSRGIIVEMNSSNTGRPRVRSKTISRGPNVTTGWPTWEQVYALGKSK